MLSAWGPRVKSTTLRRCWSLPASLTLASEIVSEPASFGLPTCLSTNFDSLVYVQSVVFHRDAKIIARMLLREGIKRAVVKYIWREIINGWVWSICWKINWRKWILWEKEADRWLYTSQGEDHCKNELGTCGDSIEVNERKMREETASCDSRDETRRTLYR